MILLNIVSYFFNSIFFYLKFSFAPPFKKTGKPIKFFEGRRRGLKINSNSNNNYTNNYNNVIIVTARQGGGTLWFIWDIWFEICCSFVHSCFLQIWKHVQDCKFTEKLVHDLIYFLVVQTLIFIKGERIKQLNLISVDYWFGWLYSAFFFLNSIMNYQKINIYRFCK